MNAEEIRATIEHFFEAMDTQDLKVMKKLIPKTNSTVHIGTDKGEIWKGWKELNNATEGQFEGLEYYKANIRELTFNVAESGDVAWYFHKLDAKIKSNGSITHWKGARFTGVLQKIDGQWVMAQTQVSIPEST
ncbi:nuclear transport factor 2 family protein [Fodinibius sp.]|uniref:nuclear transport factor 2 family protein n=1 Tax=Fodinibius sp. TaxID=1872440 RepID=UPI002ACDAE52|nr:nuclear transport factor 2 family protein [Fodinibius sp.]MDZ7657774.1 nuclear transport factor 2 family protein [Fodinibius sp.]